MKYLYIQQNKDWNSENKFKYGYTENPKNRIISEQHSHKSIYIALYECFETDNYIYSFKEYDKIISRLRNLDDNEIIQEKIEFNIDISKFIEIKQFLINDGGGTEFIKSNQGIELLDFIFIYVFKDIGINTRKLSKDEIDIVNNENNISIKTRDSYNDKENKLITLRDYQITIIDKYAIETLIKTHKFYLELATGAGKSTIIYYTLNNIILKNIHPYYTIIIFTPRINISAQNIDKKYLTILKKKFNVYYKKNIKTFNKSSYNIISCCIQSYQSIYDNFIIKYDIDNIIIWFDEAHYTIENWVSNYNCHYKQFYLNDNKRIVYRLFTSASPNKNIVKSNINIFGELYSPISVRNLIKDKWLAPIQPHIMEFDEVENEGEDDDGKKKYYYYINTILNTFQILNKTIGLNFHNSCKNAEFAFYAHYDKFINSQTNIKPYLLISDEKINKKVSEKLNDNYKYLLNFKDFHKEPNNAIAYIVNMYNMGYDNYKIDFLSFGDPKLSNKDIIQSIGRGIRSDKLDDNGKNKFKINDIIIPIYNTADNDDIYIKFSKIKEILQYLIYDIGLDIKDIKFYNNKKPKQKNKTIIGASSSELEELAEYKIIANIIKWHIEPSVEKWNLQKIITHLMNNNIHDYNSYLKYISLKDNESLNLPLELFKSYSNFNFNDTYKNNSSPYYSRDECIEAIKRYKIDFIDTDDIDKEDNNQIVEFLHKKDPKIPNHIFWIYYGGSINDYLLFA
jgi:superfamily II DNA or RNA helicase